ncbi:class I SAM-dependent methyltransferase [Bacteroidota bacterium]
MKKIVSFLMRHIPRKVLIISGYFFKYPVLLFFFGNKVECPICNGKFRKFLPYGIISRSNALCPKCLSLERHRLMWFFLERKTKFFSDELSVLHIAPEQCFRKIFRKQKNLEYVTADLESPIADVKLDIQDIPYEDCSFNVIICNHVLEHVEDDKKAMSELFRTLKKDGFALLQVPIDFNREITYEDSSITDPVEREIHFLQKDHFRLYGLDYPEKLEKSGFFVEQIDMINELPTELVKKSCLPENEKIYFAQKR